MVILTGQSIEKSKIQIKSRKPTLVGKFRTNGISDENS